MVLASCAADEARPITLTRSIIVSATVDQDTKGKKGVGLLVQRGFIFRSQLEIMAVVVGTVDCKSCTQRKSNEPYFESEGFEPGFGASVGSHSLKCEIFWSQTEI